MWENGVNTVCRGTCDVCGPSYQLVSQEKSLRIRLRALGESGLIWNCLLSDGPLPPPLLRLYLKGATHSWRQNNNENPCFSRDEGCSIESRLYWHKGGLDTNVAEWRVQRERFVGRHVTYSDVSCAVGTRYKMRQERCCQKMLLLCPCYLKPQQVSAPSG